MHYIPKFLFQGKYQNLLGVILVSLSFFNLSELLKERLSVNKDLHTGLQRHEAK